MVAPIQILLQPDDGIKKIMKFFQEQIKEEDIWNLDGKKNINEIWTLMIIKYKSMAKEIPR